MPFRLRSIAREVSTAVAVLAIYLLVLLAPLHQTAGLQRDLDALGYASLDMWSVCAPLTVDKTDDKPDVIKCPMTGIAKHDVVLTGPVSIDLGLFRVAMDTAYPPQGDHSLSRTTEHFGQARAPPVRV